MDNLPKMVISFWQKTHIVPVLKSVVTLLRNRNEDEEMVQRFETYVQRKYVKDVTKKMLEMVSISPHQGKFMFCRLFLFFDVTNIVASVNICKSTLSSINLSLSF